MLMEWAAEGQVDFSEERVESALLLVADEVPLSDAGRQRAVSLAHQVGAGELLKYLDTIHSPDMHVTDDNRNIVLVLQYFQSLLASHRGNGLKFAAELTSKTIQ